MAGFKQTIYYYFNSLRIGLLLTKDDVYDILDEEIIKKTCLWGKCDEADFSCVYDSISSYYSLLPKSYNLIISFPL